MGSNEIILQIVALLFLGNRKQWLQNGHMLYLHAELFNHKACISLIILSGNLVTCVIICLILSIIFTILTTCGFRLSGTLQPEQNY